MFKVDEFDDQIVISLSSRLELVDRAISECSSFFKKNNTSRYDSVEIVLRELLVNAVEHGNKFDITKTVNCEIKQLKDKNRYEITIADQGSGFDTKKLIYNTRQEPTQNRGRGYSIVNAYSDEIVFDNNGATVRAYITLPNETEYEVVTDGKECHITPSGDISAGNAEKLRWALIDMMNRDVNLFVFDCIHVNSIDSVSLSMLINFHNLLLSADSDAKITFMNVNRDINALFMMTRISEIISVRLNEKEGIV